MATIIDSLVVELGLDPTKFNAGQKKAVDALRELQEKSEKFSKGAAGSWKEMEESLGRLTTYALKFGGALLGASGFKDLVEKLTNMNAQLGRSAELIGVNADELSKWEKVAERAGGSAEDIRNTFSSMARAVAQVNVTGPNTEFFQWLSKLGVNYRNFIDSKGQLSDFTNFFKAISDGMAKLPAGERQLASSALGIGSQNTLLFNQGGGRIQSMLDAQERIGHITEQQAENSRAIAAAWAEIQQRLENGARILLDKWAPTIISTLRELNKILDLFNNKGADPEPNAVLSGGAAFGRYPNAYGGRGRPSTGGGFWDSSTGGGIERGPSGVRVKEGSNVPFGLYALAQSLSDLPTFGRITSGNDAFHRGLPSAHNRGLALDFTLNNPRMAAMVETAMREKFAALGIDAKVLNEYDPKQRGPHTTAPHLHVGFANQAAAKKFNAAREAGKIDFHIQNLNIKANNPTELANGVAGSGPVAGAVRNRGSAVNEQGGFQ